jgi:putative mRNA 3-end processing factor
MKNTGIVEWTEKGLYCPAGDFYIDPWDSVEKAVITHGHADHARWGCDSYLCASEGADIIRTRLGGDIRLQPLDYGATIDVGGVRLSLHPAGHILGSAQVRLERHGKVVVVTGDFKIEPDETCRAYEQLACHMLITESTFGLPVFRWPSQRAVFQEINDWWRHNRRLGRTSVLFAYALGKAQRVLAGLDPAVGPVFTHGAVEKINRRYRKSGVRLAPTRPIAEIDDRKLLKGAMVIAPPSADVPTWMRRFTKPARAFASGWMQIRGNRRRRSLDRGFVLSDHADWPGLTRAIRESGAESVWVTHGYTVEMVRWLQDNGWQAVAAETRINGVDASAAESG